MKVSVILCPSNEVGVTEYWPGKKISLSPAWWKKRMVSSFVAHKHLRQVMREREGHVYAVMTSPMFVTAVAEVDEETMIVRSVDYVDVVCFIWNGSSKKLNWPTVNDLKEHFAHHEGLVWPWLGRQAN